MFETTWADVIAMDAAPVPCRIVTQGGHAPASDEDYFRPDPVVPEAWTWMADTDRGICTAWSPEPQKLANYLLKLPPGDSRRFEYCVRA